MGGADLVVATLLAVSLVGVAGVVFGFAETRFTQPGGIEDRDAPVWSVRNRRTRGAVIVFASATLTVLAVTLLLAFV